ncbi:DUF5681 domain-containing protein [Methyloglobulus sp.]|uniref:DUF5681 domain-containing protein n=1 Tax=Methyloglobulus sp. TaxID=2518622 RepID=UPI0032B823DB
MGKFKEGESGNPSGRPPGLTTANKIRHEIQESLPSILKTVVKAAQSGDMAACKLILDRVCPTIKSVALPINLPFSGGLVDQGNAVIQATLTGQIPPDIGAQLITALSNQGKLVDLEEMSDRLARIEKQLSARK